jgi:hypothetical protein
LLSGFRAAAFPTSNARFRFDQAALYGCFEDGLLVTSEVGFDTLEVGDGFVEA